MCGFDCSFFYQKHFVSVQHRLQPTLWTWEIVLHTHKMFVGLLEARKITFVASYIHGYRRMRGVWRRMQICMHIWGYIFWLSWQCSNWRRSVASSRMNLTQISFRFVFDWKTHSQAFRKHLKHLKHKEYFERRIRKPSCLWREFYH